MEYNQHSLPGVSPISIHSSQCPQSTILKWQYNFPTNVRDWISCLKICTECRPNEWER